MTKQLKSSYDKFIASMSPKEKKEYEKKLRILLS